MNPRQRNDCQASYDLVAGEYVRRIFDELQHKPLDRQLLDRFAASLRGVGAAWICRQRWWRKPAA